MKTTTKELAELRLCNLRDEIVKKIDDTIDLLFNEPEARPREYVVDEIVEPSETKDVVFGVPFVEPGTRFAGFPETGIDRVAVEHLFRSDYLYVNAGDAKQLGIVGILMANRSLFISRKPIPATRFVGDKSPKLVLPNEPTFKVDLGCQIVVQVINATKKSRRFRARVVGHEVV